jgi:2-dehydro-3-deoxyphosphogluconate aldolase/(4S)-4-hydroxy-2-oxoglutarate aldolase
MLRKYQIISKIVEERIIAIVRTDSPEKAEKIADACVAGGIKILEITFSVPGADEVIRVIRNKYTQEVLLLGAGTVLDAETARIAQLAGASFIISPSFNPETAKICNRYQIPYIPGCMTIKEITEAMEAGAELVKLFPGSVLKPDSIKAIHGPLPQVMLIPTGGVALDNLDDWFNAGCAAVAVGGSLTRVEGNDYAAVTERCQKFLAKIDDICRFT